MATGTDPFELAKRLWPSVKFYSKQREVIWSVWHNKTTIVPAGHKLGKDFVAGFIALAFFLTRNPCKVMTTSVDGTQLEQVLWGEIRRFIQTSSVELDSTKGGPLIINHMNIRKIYKGKMCGQSFIAGKVAQKGEGMSGHHLEYGPNDEPRTLFLGDEGSGIDQQSFDRSQEWAHRRFIIGNPYDCENEFRWAVEGKPGEPFDSLLARGGDIPHPTGDDYLRKIIRIEATDSPNVQLALREIELNPSIPPSRKKLLPGVLDYDEFLDRLATWDEIKKCVGLFARFYRGKDLLLFPPEHLNYATLLHDTFELSFPGRSRRRTGWTLGVDCGQGVSNTSMVAVDPYGILDLQSIKTPDTSLIGGMVIDFARRNGVPKDRWYFDIGGGGLQIAQQLRSSGYPVHTVGFGEGLSHRIKRRQKMSEKKSLKEERYAYMNRRAQMYHELSLLLDPTTHPARGHGFAIPRIYSELLRQLAPFPKLYRDGRLFLPPKYNSHLRKSGKGGGGRTENTSSAEVTIEKLIGCSPDDADALCLAVFGMLHPERQYQAGVMS